jgi:hypothetical protein
MGSVLTFILSIAIVNNINVIHCFVLFAAAIHFSIVACFSCAIPAEDDQGNKSSARSREFEQWHQDKWIPVLLPLQSLQQQSAKKKGDFVFPSSCINTDGLTGVEVEEALQNLKFCNIFGDPAEGERKVLQIEYGLRGAQPVASISFTNLAVEVR